MKHIFHIFLCFYMVGLLAMSPCNAEEKENTQSVFVAPASIPTDIITRMNESKKSFITELNEVIKSDKDNLLIFVDKNHELSSNFVPSDLVSLTKGKSYTIGRKDLSLRIPAEKALEQMALAARKEGITLLASSTYRSYAYQKVVYNRNVREMGQKAADRESARPGTSQHQLGTVVDFGSITDEYANTQAGKWLAQHAGEYGWSLSFPEGYESVTGYRWECWHYRYIGRAAVDFQKKWFDDIQQYMLEFIDAWKN